MITSKGSSPHAPSTELQLKPHRQQRRGDLCSGLNICLSPPSILSPNDRSLVERPQNQKRQSVEEPPRNNPPAKRVETAMPNERDNYPPEFWDDLSRVWLTPRALRECDRRNRTPSASFTAPQVHSTAPKVHSAELAQFAKHGGPDLRDIRGVSLSFCLNLT